MIKKSYITRDFGKKTYPPIEIYSGEFRGRVMTVFVKKGGILLLSDCALEARNWARKGVVPADAEMYAWDQTAEFQKDEFYRFFIKSGEMQTTQDQELQSLIVKFVCAGEGVQFEEVDVNKEIEINDED